MVALQPVLSILTNSSSSSYAQAVIYPIIANDSLASLATSRPQEWKFSMTKINVRNNSLCKPVLAPLSCRPSNSLHTNFSTNLPTEMGLFSLLRKIGFNERETQLLLDRNPSLNFAPFESIQTRILSLESLGIVEFSLSSLIAKHPDILTAKEIDGLLRFISDDLEGKIEPSLLFHLLDSAEPKFLVDFERKLRLLLHHGIPPEKLAHILDNVNLNKAIWLKSVEDMKRTLTFMNQFSTGIDIIVRRPSILNYNLETQLIPRIGVIKELSGGDLNATGSVLLKLPAILTYSAEHLQSHVEFLKSFAGLENNQIFKIVLVYPNVFSASRKRKLRPRIEFLKQCGLTSMDIFKFLIKAPLFLSLSFENLNMKLGFLVKIGYVHRTREMAIAIGAVTRTSYENLQKVIGLFLKYFSCVDIVAMSKKHPQVLQYNHSSLEEKMNYLVEEMGREIEEVLAFPAFLGYKLNSRIKHRYEVKKEITGEEMSLNKLLSVSTERFSQQKKNMEKKNLAHVNHTST